MLEKLEKEIFIQILDKTLERNKELQRVGDNDRINICVQNSEMIDFDIEEVLKEWIKQYNDINLLVFDTPKLTRYDIDHFEENMTKPTILFLKNYGDYVYESDLFYLRERFRTLIKDCGWGATCKPIDNFVFAIVTTTSAKPLTDMGDRICFRHLNRFIN